jgi:hypothetical protein
VNNELIRKNVEGNGHSLIFWHLIGVTEENLHNIRGAYLRVQI